MAFVARICALVLVWMSICHAHTLTDVAVCLASGDLSRLHTILGADPSLLNARHASTGQTPLMMATLQGKTDAVKALLQMDGVDVTIGEKDGYTPMHGAGFQGRSDIVPLLVAHGVAVDDVHRDGYSPLHRAAWGAEARHTQTVEMLIKLGADPYRVGLKDGKTALEMAQQRGNLKTAKLLKKLMRKTTPTSPPDSVPESSSEPLIDKANKQEL